MTEIRRGKSADSGQVEREVSDHGAGGDGAQPQEPEQGHRGPAQGQFARQGSFAQQQLARQGSFAQRQRRFRIFTPPNREQRVGQSEARELGEENYVPQGQFFAYAQFLNIFLILKNIKTDF